MTEQTTGVTAPGAGEMSQGQASQPIVQSQVSQDQGMPQTPQATTPITSGTVTPQDNETRTVPVHVLKTVETKYKDTLSENQTLKNQLAQAQALQRMGISPQPQQQSVQPQPQQQSQIPNALDGLQDHELLSVADFKKILPTLKPETPDFNQVLQPVNERLAEMQLQLQDPTYKQTIQTYLPDMINANPLFMETINRMPSRTDKIAMALTLAKMSPKYLEAQNQTTQKPVEQQQEDPLTMLNKIIMNATMPAAPATQGGTGAVSGFDRFKQMNNADFDAEVRRVLGR